MLRLTVDSEPQQLQMGGKMAELDPSRIMQLGTSFFAAKTLLSAVEQGLFTELAKRPMTGQDIASSLGLHRRAIPDFPDALVALGLLSREGDGPEARYMNTLETAAFLDRQSPDYVGGLLEMLNARLYGFWADLTEALKTGKAQNEIKHSGAPMFDTLYERPVDSPAAAAPARAEPVAHILQCALEQAAGEAA